MLRAIPLPDESIQSLKRRHDPLAEFQFRMGLVVLDAIIGTDPIDVVINNRALETLVLNNDWPKC